MDTDKLKGIAVVSQDEGTKLGQVSAILFEPTTLQLRAFQVKGDGQTFVVPLDQVGTIGTDALMVQSSQATQTAAKGGEFGHLVEFDTLKKLKVVDAAGTFVGTMRDLALDPATGRPLQLVIHKGGTLGFGGKTTTIAASAISSVGAEVITIAAAGATTAS
jgi:sporulation protein YlmC with PRC-barrel domain